MLDQALEVAGLGLRAFPLRPLSESPVVDHWEATASSDVGALRLFLGGGRSTGYGIVTGDPDGIFAVELQDKAAVQWWRSQGFTEGAIVTAPTNEHRQFRCFQMVGPLASSTPREGVRIHGSGSYIAGPGSMLSTGSFRGSLSAIPVADFDPRADLASGAEGRSMPFLSAASLLPQLTTAGATFERLLFHEPEEESPDLLRGVRATILRECFAGGLDRHEASSVAWGSYSGRDLWLLEDGWDRMLSEAAEASRATEELIPWDPSRTTPDLMSGSEREQIEGKDWWGSRYVARSPEHLSTYRRLYRWTILSAVFAPEGHVPKRSGPMSLELGVVALGSTAAIHEASGAMDELLRFLLPRRSKSDGQASDVSRLKAGSSRGIYTGNVSDGASTAKRLGVDGAAKLIWAVDPEADLSIETFREDQVAPVPVPIVNSTSLHLATQLADAREKLTALLGQSPYFMLMSEETLVRHGELKSTLGSIPLERFETPRISGEWASGFADLVRKCATLVAMSAGSAIVELEHELIAIEQAEEWLASLLWVVTGSVRPAE